MKKVFMFLVAFVMMSATLAQKAGAQQRVVKVQGHPHELLTQKAAEGKLDQPVSEAREVGNVTSINPSDIRCWAGAVDASRAISRAALIVKWTDGKRKANGDSILIWGYRWNTLDTFGDTAKVYTIDMIRAVANADCRFSALLENTSGGNFVAGGFGYNYAANSRVPVTFDLNGAIADTLVKFSYLNSPNCSVGQGAIPYDPAAQALNAITKSITPVGKSTGIISDPFNADYGYPAYDFDYWKLTASSNVNFEWQAGWYRTGYWAFYVKNSWSGNFSYANNGIATQQLKDQSVSGFVFAINFDYSKDMSGNYTAVTCNCGCNATTQSSSVKK